MGRTALNLKKLPYAQTSISIDKSKGDIDKILRKAGADGIQWSELYRPERQAQIRFINDKKVYKLSIPLHLEDLESQRRNIAPVRFDQYVNQRERSMYRAMYHYIESLIKAQENGLGTVMDHYTAGMRDMRALGQDDIDWLKWLLEV